MSGVHIYDHIPIHDLDDDNLFTSLNHPLLYLFNQLFFPVNLTQTRKHSSGMRTVRLSTIRKGGVLSLEGVGAILGGKAILRRVPQELTSSNTPPPPRGTE